MNGADIQVLASIRRAEVEGESCDRATLEGGADRYWKYLEDTGTSSFRCFDDVPDARLRLARCALPKRIPVTSNRS